jgi:hypothetical protein
LTTPALQGVKLSLDLVETKSSWQSGYVANRNKHMRIEIDAGDTHCQSEGISADGSWQMPVATQRVLVSGGEIMADPGASLAPGPTPQEFTALRIAKGETCPPIRNLACAPIGDAPVFECKWEERFEGKPWISGSALVTRNGAEWLWLNGGPRCLAIPQY